jgi:regulator of nucleoside diphosphate kinase
MSKRRIQITKYDMKRLQDLLMKAEQSEYHGSIYLQSLSKEMKRAIQVAPKEIPPDVITMNSCARLVDCDTGEDLEYTLVFPENADIEKDRISVLAPIGTAMLPPGNAGCASRRSFTSRRRPGISIYRADFNPLHSTVEKGAQDRTQKVETRLQAGFLRRAAGVEALEVRIHGLGGGNSRFRGPCAAI